MMQYQAYDFDRTHILNVVGGMKFARNWELGGRLVFQTGSPLKTREGGFASGRSAPNWRVDLRMDKRVVFNEWLLDFYIEILNIAVTDESGGLIGKEGFRYVLPDPRSSGHSLRKPSKYQPKPHFADQIFYP